MFYDAAFFSDPNGAVLVSEMKILFLSSFYHWHIF